MESGRREKISEEEKKDFMPVVLTVAGSDSGGGAGIQADLRTFSALKVYGTSAITSITSQNPEKVHAVYGLPEETLASQINAVLDVFPLSGVKTGMLYSLAMMKTLRGFLPEFTCPVITDPVMISTSGRRLMQEDAVKFLLENILPFVTFVTPNIPEAEFLCNEKILSEKDMVKAAAKCAEKYHCSVFLKGGHISGMESVPDVIWHRGEYRIIRSDRVPVSGYADHGTGCTLSSAFTAYLARGESWEEAARKAKIFVAGSLMGAVTLSPKGVMGMFPPSPEVGKVAEKTVKMRTEKKEDMEK